MIQVTKPFMPPREEYQKYLDEIWKSGWLTNQGPLEELFLKALSERLEIGKWVFVGNGTLALQLILNEIAGKGKIITTPFSYVATLTSILWEKYEPVFVDINEEDLNLNPQLVRDYLRNSRAEVSAILPTHVFGNPCDIEAFDSISKEFGIPVVYDAAHCFGVEVDGESIFNFGFASASSFHATKIFHTIEGGGVFSKDQQMLTRIARRRNFGHDGKYGFPIMGINAKNNEFGSAMGLVNLKHIDHIIEERRSICNHYDSTLDWRSIRKPSWKQNATPNYSYYPLLFNNAQDCESVLKALEAEEIYPRRYFFPSLNTLPYLKDTQSCPVSESAAERVLTLPLYVGLELESVERISAVVNKSLASR